MPAEFLGNLPKKSDYASYAQALCSVSISFGKSMAADLCRQAEPFCGDAANAECGNAQQKPQSRKGQADLSVEVQRHAAVVPDVPAESQINDATGQEL